MLAEGLQARELDQISPSGRSFTFQKVNPGSVCASRQGSISPSGLTTMNRRPQPSMKEGGYSDSSRARRHDLHPGAAAMDRARPSWERWAAARGGSRAPAQILCVGELQPVGAKLSASAITSPMRSRFRVEDGVDREREPSSFTERATSSLRSNDRSPRWRPTPPPRVLAG